MSKRWPLLLAAFLAALFLLAGCYLVSGERVETFLIDETRPGVYTAHFVSADGRQYREIEAGLPGVPVVVDVSARTEEGQLVLELLDIDYAPALTVTARFGLQGQGSAAVRTDGAGRIVLRISANEAHEGTFTLRYRLAAPLTPTPTSPPTPAP